MRLDVPSTMSFPFHSRFGISAVKFKSKHFPRIRIRFSAIHQDWEGNYGFVKRIIMSYWYPPTYYNHFLEHPILWSKEKRRWEEQRLSHECYSVWQTQERINRSEKLRNQSEVWKPQSRVLNQEQKTKARKKHILVITFFVAPSLTTLRSISIKQPVIILLPSSPWIIHHRKELEVLEAHFYSLFFLLPHDTISVTQLTIHLDPWYFYCEFPTLCKCPFSAESICDFFSVDKHFVSVRAT